MGKIAKWGGAMLFIVLVIVAAPRVSPVYGAALAPAAFLMLGLVALRPVVRTWVRHRGCEGTLILGSQDTARRLYNEWRRQGDEQTSVHVMGYGDWSQLPRDVPRGDSIVLTDLAGLERQDIAAALIDYKLRGIRVETVTELFERRERRIRLEGLSPEYFIRVSGFRPSAFYLRVKRVCDIVIGALALLVAVPLGLVIAAAIKLESRGPAIFRQERVGLRGRNFTVLKFRSMRMDAEKDGPAWAREQDGRVTRVGRFLRRTRLDEIPQIINVLRGEMSLVGPRPERPYFVDILKQKIPFYDVRHYVKPGVTGWAQVMYPYGASVEDAYQKLQYDLYYAKNISFRLDVITLIRTLKVVAAGEGR